MPRDPRLEGLPAHGELLAGKYRIERTVNVGRVAVVVEGTDVQLRQRVAIKILAGEAAQSERRLARFSREGSAGATIQSEHVVRVLELGSFVNGAFMVMEYLEGEDLSKVIERGRLPISTAVDYLLQAAEVIAEAHELGIVHRDLKPANLFVAQRADGSPWIKLLDFGVAKFGDGITTTASFLGSPLYMAPEQLASAKHADARADIWALGTLLFEMVAGTTPFPLQSLTEVCSAIIYAEPRRLREFVPHAPAALEAAIDRCLRKNREERFANVAALAGAIAHFGGRSAKTSLAQILRVAPGRKLIDSRSDEDELPTMLYVADASRAPVPPATSSGYEPAPLAVTSDEPPPRRSRAALVLATLGALICLALGGLGAYVAFAPPRLPAAAAPPPATPEPSASAPPPAPSASVAPFQRVDTPPR